MIGLVRCSALGAGITLLLAGCIGAVRSEYGSKNNVGDLLPTSCVTVENFAAHLRSAPGLHGPDHFVAYEDFGPGMSRGTTFLVAPVLVSDHDSIGQLLRQTDPRRRSFWTETKLVSGALLPGEDFSARVPANKRLKSENVVITDRQAVLVRGRLEQACEGIYLIAAMDNPMITEDRDWEALERAFSQFVSSLSWPGEN